MSRPNAIRIFVSGRNLRTVRSRLFEGVAGHESLYLRRHWLNGPHVQIGGLRFSPGGQRDVDHVVQLAVDAVDLARAGPVDDDYPETARWLEVSESCGRVELVPGPYAPIWREWHIDRRDEPRLFPRQIGGPRVQAFRACSLHRMGQALQSLAAGAGVDEEPSQAAVVGLAVRSLVTLAATYPTEGLRFGYLSLYSHAIDLLHEHDRSGAARRALEPVVARISKTMTGLVDDVLANGAKGVLAQTLQLVQEEGEALAREHEIQVMLPDEFTDRAAAFDGNVRKRWSTGTDRSLSDFHRAFKGLRFTDAEEGVRFAAYRHLSSFFYEQLNLFGISPNDRMLVSLAIAEAVERKVGTWQELVATEGKWHRS